MDMDMFIVFLLKDYNWLEWCHYKLLYGYWWLLNFTKQRNQTLITTTNASFKM